ncbi:MAG: hypothetical protein HZT43_11655 [Exiguobacterium profundum]|nr:MAG: hypothetical protein HZT43_11655 [Exiguobacterium profundum]
MELDNTAAERGMRAIALRRKNSSASAPRRAARRPPSPAR